uniref:Temporin-1CSc n=1 Tax=Rana cascadae TaxID=160497 RepID=TP1C_RANCS|nr:RecName: Full=Temporin-1CSc [Rana cascadae]
FLPLVTGLLSGLL